MAITNINISSPANFFQYQDTNIGSSVDAIKASSAVLYSILADNSSNGGAACYVKIWNTASGSVTVGTTVPDEIIYVPAGQIVEHFLFTSSVSGKTFGTALSAACVTTGGTSGTTAPTNPVKCTFNYV